jgi:periplasmic divalent cation tolerance protein
VVLKSSADVYPHLESYLKQHHEWGNPEIVAVPVVAGSTPYLSWVHSITGVADVSQGR